MARASERWFFDRNDNAFCPDCWADHVEDCDEDTRLYVRNYSYKPDPSFHSTGRRTKKPPLYMGVELEIDEGAAYASCQKGLHALDRDEDLFYLKADGSLGSRGIEVVTHPCTLNHHLTVFPWREITQVAHANGYQSHNTSTCGLHVHVSRNALGEDVPVREATIAKIILMVDRFWDKLSVFSRRDLDRSRYVRKPNADIKQGDTVEEAVEKTKNLLSERYHAVNLQNAATIEFRIFKGTLVVDTIKATLELVNNICLFAKTRSLRRCMSASWKEVALLNEYPELDKYLISLDLYK